MNEPSTMSEFLGLIAFTVVVWIVGLSIDKFDNRKKKRRAQ